MFLLNWPVLLRIHWGTLLMSGKMFRINLEDPYTKGTKQEASGSEHEIVSGKYGLYLTVTDGKSFNFPILLGKH